MDLKYIGIDAIILHQRLPNQKQPVYKNADTFTGLFTAAEFPSLNRYDTPGFLSHFFCTPPAFLFFVPVPVTVIDRPKKSVGGLSAISSLISALGRFAARSFDAAAVADSRVPSPAGASGSPSSPSWWSSSALKWCSLEGRHALGDA